MYFIYFNCVYSFIFLGKNFFNELEKYIFGMMISIYIFSNGDRNMKNYQLLLFVNPHIVMN